MTQTTTQSSWNQTIFGDLPNNWSILDAQSYCIKVADGTHDSPKQKKYGKLLVTSKNLKNGQLDLTSAYYISVSDFDEVNRRSMVDKWDVLLSMIGTVGEICLIKNDPDFAIKNVGLFKCGDEIKAKWLYYFLRSSLGKNYLLGKLNGTTQKYITLGELRKFPIVMPPLPEQRAIAVVLSSLDDKIELLREQNKTLEETAQVIFQEWFGKYGVDDELPEGWRVGKIYDLINILSGFAFKSSDFVEGGKYGLVTIRNVQDGSFVQDTKDRLDVIPSKTPDYCRLKTGDILLSLTGNVGRICHVVGENYLLNQRVAKLQSKNDKDFSFAYLFFRQESMIGLLENISAGTAQQNLSPIKTGEIEMVIPTREKLDRFAEITNPIIEKILSNLQQIQTLSTLRDTLLPRLMRGEVRVDSF